MKYTKVLSIIAIVALLVAMTAFAFACQQNNKDKEEEKEPDPVKYETLAALGFEVKVSSDTTMKLNKYDGASATVEVPKKVLLDDKVYTITEIGETAFGAQSDITSIVIPDSIVKIGASAFNGTSITEFVMPDSVTTVGDNCFSFCSELKTITLSKNLTTIGNTMFRRCSKLESLAIPDSVTSIGKQFIYECDKLETLYVGKGVKTINSQALYNNLKLKYVYIDSQKAAEDETFMETLDFYFNPNVGITINTDIEAVYVLDTIEVTPGMNMGGMKKQEGSETYNGKTYDIYKG